METIDTVKNSISESIKRAVSYSNFRDIIDNLAATAATSGKEQKESLVNYTQLNSRRLKRWEKTFKIDENVADIIKQWDRPVIWLVLTESWCGDAAPTMPVMEKVAQLNGHIELKVLFRDENLQLMDLFKTDGARAIPKMIMVDTNSLEVLGEWGPRPSKATQMAKEYKSIHGKLTPEFKQDLQLWYNRDKGQNTLQDLMRLLALEDVGNGALL
ncbi:MAG: thioredoxin family protein [Eudoraea sp.]|nr:thioredoxin family protein [Eudoraea sp.]